MEKKRLLQIEVCMNTGSTGRIAEGISGVVKKDGWDAYLIHGARYNNPPTSMIEFQLGSITDEYEHFFEHIVFDNDGLASRKVTRRIVNKIEEIKPDVIQLHDIHDHWINYRILFEYFATLDTPIVWTQHDCWGFTGGCGHFSDPECYKWRDGTCSKGCPQVSGMRKLFEKTYKHFQLRRELLTSIKDLTLVPVSYWMESVVKQSFLKGKKIVTIHNGVDINLFKQSDSTGVRVKYGIGSSKYVLGVSSQWLARKGWFDFQKLSHIISHDIKIVLIGVTEKQQKEAAKYGIIGIRRTENINEMAALYSGAMMFCNLTYMDTFPTTNIEALACATPVLTYNTDGSVEAADDETGWVVEQGDIKNVVDIILRQSQLSIEDINAQRNKCRLRAVKFFDKDKCFAAYLDLYKELISKD